MDLERTGRIQAVALVVEDLNDRHFGCGNSSADVEERQAKVSVLDVLHQVIAHPQHGATSQAFDKRVEFWNQHDGVGDGRHDIEKDHVQRLTLKYAEEHLCGRHNPECRQE